MKRISLPLLVIFFAIDQATKAWAMIKGKLAICSFLNFKLQTNSGIAFGLLESFGTACPLLLAIISISIIPLVFYMFKDVASDFYTKIAHTLIAAGSLSNAYDRIARGFVVDFIRFEPFQWHWSTFNVADVMIITSILYLHYRDLTRAKRC